MKQFFKMFFASFLAMVVMGVIIFALIMGLVAGLASDKEEGRDVASNSVLRIEMGKAIHESGESNPLAALSGGAYQEPGLYEIIKSIEHAKTDDNIKGIFIELEMTSNGWATLQQLRQAVLDFKTSNKFVYAYGEMVPQKSYYLASAADSIFLNPAGYTQLNGLASEMPFFKGTLQKLEIEPEIFYAGKFKSATEPFRADKISEPNRQQIMAIQQDIWTEFTNAVAAHAHVTAATVDSWAQTGIIQSPEDALNNKLVDGLRYIDEVEDRIKDKTGKKKETDKISYVDIDDYSKTVRGKRKFNDTRIALLVAEGSITDGESGDTYQIASKDMIETIRKIRNNDKIKAVVMRVNSPGGSALASEVILRELQLLRRKKPLIVSMGDVAASGGYYIACEADSVFALPNTITGSIGVFSMLFNAEAMLKNKLGITFDEVKNAPYADFPTVIRPFTEQERQRMQASVDSIYHLFLRRVASGRKMQEFMVDSIAQGRVWTGTDAMAIGLVDGLGGLDRAIWSAAQKAGVKDYQVVTYPEPSDKLEALLRRFGGADMAGNLVKETLKEEATATFEWISQIRNLKNMNGRAQMLMPYSLNIR